MVRQMIVALFVGCFMSTLQAAADDRRPENAKNADAGSAFLRYERAIAKAQLEFGKKVADARRKLSLDLDKALLQPPKAARPADVERRPKIRIISAFYGQNVSWLDVTDRVRQATKGKRNWAVQVRTEDWGEPAPGFGGPRTLLIRYSVNGEVNFKSQYQGSQITLP